MSAPCHREARSGREARSDRKGPFGTPSASAAGRKDRRGGVGSRLLGGVAAALCFVATVASCNPGGTGIDPRYQGAAKHALDQYEFGVGLVAHSGERRIRTTRRLPSGQPRVAEYRESVGVDGRDNFQLECIEVLQSPLADPSDFIDRMNRNEGFLYRYRDFHITDSDLLIENYVVLQFGRQLDVAGRACFTLELERRDDPQQNEPIIGWDLAIDLETGLVLQWQRTVNGSLTDEGVYEWVTYGVPSTFVAHVGSNQEYSFEPSEVRSLFTFDLTTPTMLPHGFQRIDRARVVDAEDVVWLKETFSDGIEAAFFLYTVDQANAIAASGAKPLGDLRVADGTAIGPGGAISGGGPSALASELVSVEGASVGITQYLGAGRRAIVAGRIGADDRRWMIESAIF